jgi:hypothetical protein
MIKYKSGTHWLGDREVGVILCAVCNVHMETESANFFFEPKKDRRFLGLGLKTDSSGLIIYDSKSPQRFLNLSLKIK